MDIADIWKQSLMGRDKKTDRLISLLTDCTDTFENALRLFATATNVPINPIEISALDNARAIALLAQHNQCKEVYIISRALVEALITYYYVACSEDETVHSYYHHYLLQKQYRNLRKTIINTGDQKIVVKASHIPNLEEYPYIKDAVDKYTGTKGNPKTRWVSDNLEKMLSKIKESTDVDIKMLMLGVNIVYSDASEALHATSYGCIFPFGLATLGSSFNPKTVNHQFHGTMQIPLLYISQLISWHAKKVAEATLKLERDNHPDELFQEASKLVDQTNELKKLIVKAYENKESKKHS